MGLLSGKTKTAVGEPNTTGRCLACGTTDQPVEKLPTLGLTACVDPIACRRRAENAGIWKTYP